jgi:hypothetical protein
MYCKFIDYVDNVLMYLRRIGLGIISRNIGYWFGVSLYVYDEGND